MSKKKPENINNHHDLEVSNTFFLQNLCQKFKYKPLSFWNRI